MPGRRSSRNVRREFTFPWRRFVCALVLFIVGLVSTACAAQSGHCSAPSQAPPRVNPPAAPAQIFCIIGLVKVELAFGIVGIIAVLPGTPGAE